MLGGGALVGVVGTGVLGELPHDQVSFLFTEELSVRRDIGQDEVGEGDDEHGDAPFDDEEPSPPGNTLLAVHQQDTGGDKPRKGRRQKRPRVKHGVTHGKRLTVVPLRKRQQCRGEKPGFNDPQKHSDGDEPPVTLHGGGTGGNGTP